MSDPLPSSNTMVTSIVPTFPSFDAGFARSVGYPVRRLDLLLTALLVVAIVIGIQTVGVVLMAAMLITPRPPA